MDFWKDLGRLHVYAKEIPCLTGPGAPGPQTEGAPGVLYMDTDSGALYKCRGGEKGACRWECATPVRGVDYYTEADKAELVELVLQALGGTMVFGYVDSGNNIIISNLADGSYNVMYEMADGSTLEIGSLELDSTVYYRITGNLTNCVSSNGAVEAAGGESYEATITANDGFELKSVTVTMGGAAVAVSGGNISIAEVTGDIVITAVAEEKAAEPAYTNLADPTSSDWWADSMLNSSAAQKAAAGFAVSNFIGPVNAGDIIYIKGMDIAGTVSEYRCAPYKSDKTLHSSYGTGTLSALSGLSAKPITAVTVTATGGQFTNNKSDIKYWRIGGKPNGTADGVIITINEPIA